MNWCTLFGNTADPDSEVAFISVVEWAIENDIGFTWKELTDLNKAEYFVDTSPTLRWFSEHAGRRECVGLDEILEFVKP